VVLTRQLQVDAAQELAVACRSLRAQSPDLREPLELPDPERGGDVAEAVVVAEADVLEPAAGLRPALGAEGADQVPLLLRVRRHNAALTRRDLLVRVEGEDARGALGAEGRAAIDGAERLTGVLDQGQSVAVGDRAQLVELAGIAVDV